jgi:hypothetical protein
MDVKIFVGAHAYACITDAGVKHDIRLEPGKSANESLKSYAKGKRRKAAEYIEEAERAERAAAHCLGDRMVWK